ncbi:hypothetical protein BV96_04192 [Sphingomonas paucimobilis]|nr:hypothetical protein BV96_04192 [Sphingomonas paucimobilis]
MATLFEGHAAQGAGYAKRMSTHLAAALVIFCLMQIFIVAKMGGSLVLHLGIIVAIGAFAIFARGLERRWEVLDFSALSRSSLNIRFRRDVAQLWLVSIASGLLWIPTAIIFRFLFG